MTTAQPSRLAREELMQLPISRYTGLLHVCTTEADLTAAAEAIQHERVIGFDTEARPTFRKGPAHPPCLVQVATGHAVYLFQLNRSINLFFFLRR